MASDMATRRLRKELLAIKRTPIDNIVAAPLDSNILEWHYVITGTKGSPYEGGHYHGKLKFPPEYPMKPPSVMMLTPNGRFACARRLCLSMSDFHPESWNPMWSVSTILMGLYSFMLDTSATLGSVTSTTAQKKVFAAESLEFNCKNPAFRKLFPELVELNEKRKREASAGSTGGSGGASRGANQIASAKGNRGGSGAAALGQTQNSSGPNGQGSGSWEAGGGRDKGSGGRGRGANEGGKGGGGGVACLWVSAGLALGIAGLVFAWAPHAS